MYFKSSGELYAGSGRLVRYARTRAGEPFLVDKIISRFALSADEASALSVE